MIKRGKFSLLSRGGATIRVRVFEAKCIIRGGVI
jgi:hypothetical protein